MTSTPIQDTSNIPRRWPWFIIGVTLFLLGPILAFVQFGFMEKLTTPWQVPILASLGAICMLLSVLQRGGVMRIAGFFLFAFVSGFEWYMMLVGITTPAYTGPTAGNPLPVFNAKLADGRAFANTDLANGQSSVMLFNRGRW
jgi:hypothetical protein